MSSFFLVLATLIGVLTYTEASNNGLARTPPMGWLSWERFRCNTDCTNDPTNCISEKLYMDMADRLAADGYKDAGYVYVNIDDCWSSKTRDPKTYQLVADPVRFPHGIKYLADYVHAKGLKLGIYGDMGTLTCGGYPGSKFTMELDAATFAAWGIDSFKMDGCYSSTDDFTVAYPIMAGFLNRTGRPILFSCSWPAYIQSSDPNYQRIAEYCNIWRNYDDIDDSWDSVKSIINYYGDDKYNFSAVAGPGNFNDPDMIIIGNRGLSTSQAQAQMAMWAIFAAPLFLSNDLREIDATSRDIILNKGVLAINQDPLGIMGRRIWTVYNIQAYLRPVTPVGSYAVALLNLNYGGYPARLTISLTQLGVKGTDKYNLTEVFTGRSIGVFTVDQVIPINVDVSSVFLGKFTIIKSSQSESLPKFSVVS